MLDEFNEKRRAVLDTTREISKLAHQLGSPSATRRIESELVQKLEQNRFHLVVVGEFNHGKTTFVNALLGKTLFPVGVTPTTAVIHEIDYSEQPTARALYESGEVRELAFDDVQRFACGNAPPEPEHGPVRALHVGFPAELLRDQIALVDTPGVNDLSLQRADITYKYIPQSDAVLFLLDAGQLVKESERVFLQEKLLGNSRDKIVFIVTKRDILSADELQEAMQYVRRQLAKLISEPQVFAVSALRHLEGQTESSGMHEMLSYLKSYLADQRGRILLDNALGEALAGCALLGKGIDAKRRGLEMSAEEIDRRIRSIEADLAGQAKTIDQRRASIREEVAAIKAWARRDLEHMVQDVSRQVPAVVDNASIEDLKAHLGPFLERSVRDWAQAETRELADALELLAEKTIALVREDAREAAKRLATTLGSDVHAPAITVDTFAYDVGVAALATVGLGVLFANWMLGGMLMLAAPILAIYMRERVEEETRKRAKELAPKAVQEAAALMGPKLEEMIDEFAARLDAWVVSASEELYREVMEVLQAARHERERGEAARALAIADCHKQATELANVVTKFEQLRAGLWTPVVQPAAS